MGGFRTVRELVDAESSARNYAWRKVPNQTTTIGIWFDLSMSAGNPPPKFWFDATPLTAKIVSQSLDGGIFHGSNVSPKTKYLRKTMAMTATSTAVPMPMILCDYLMYYPTIGEDTTDEQFLTNSITLPRYTDGEGVQCLAISVAARTGGQTFSIKYTNSQGVSGRISPTVMQNTVSVIGSIVTSERQGSLYSGAFMPLQAGDTGIRSIESVTMNGVDVGLFSLVLVKPLGDMMIRGIDAPVEVDWFLDKKEIPIIQDDAYLSWLIMPIFSMANSPVIGTIKTIIK
jgi:hypothetical protein